MDELAISSLLEKLISTDNRDLNLARQKYANWPPEHRAGLVWSEISGPLRALLSEQPEFSGNVMFRQTYGETSALAYLPGRLLQQAESKGPQAAAAWLSRIRATIEADILEILPLWGIEVDQKTLLVENVELQAFDQLPMSTQRQNLENPRPPGPGTSAYALSAPTAALVSRQILRPIWTQHRDKPIESIFIDTSHSLDEIRMCLSLVGPSTIVPAIRWFQFSDADLEEAIPGPAYFWSHMEISPIKLHSLGNFDVGRAANLVARYMNIEGGDRTRIRLALNRFDRALRRVDPGDAALELAIALEALLGEGGTELTYKVSLRSGLLPGGSQLERRDRRALVQAIYSLRSTVAHTGSTPSEARVKGLGKINIEELISKGIATTATVIASAINRGRLPDWFEEELGS